jgi:hypothetical protein
MRTGRVLAPRIKSFGRIGLILVARQVHLHLAGANKRLDHAVCGQNSPAFVTNRSLLPQLPSVPWDTLRKLAAQSQNKSTPFVLVHSNLKRKGPKDVSNPPLVSIRLRYISVNRIVPLANQNRGRQRPGEKSKACSRR